jgi:hypothetical protein
MRDPNLKPGFSDIVNWIQKKDLLVPDTDRDLFDLYLAGSATCQHAALAGILAASVDSILRKAAIDRTIYWSAGLFWVAAVQGGSALLFKHDILKIIHLLCTRS